MRITIVVAAFLIALILAASSAFANVGIEKSTVGAKRVEIRGTADEAHEIVVSIAKTEKPLEWGSSCKAGEFLTVIEKSDSIPIAGGGKGKGFVWTTTQGGIKAITKVVIEEEPVAGIFSLRPEAKCETKDGVFTFGDVTLVDGTKCPVSIRLERK